MKKLILNLTPTGMIPTRNMTPHVPITPPEIASDVAACVPFGVSMVHLHARDESGVPTYVKSIYGDILGRIRATHPDLVLVVSTSGRNFPEFNQRSEVLDLEDGLRPDMASLTLSSLNFPATASVNSPDMIQRLAGRMQEKGIKPELEVFDLGMANYAHYLIHKGLITPPYYFNIILGNVASAQAKLQHLGLIVSELPPGSIWSVGGIGDAQLAMNTVGITCADGVRVGLEDNIFFSEDRSVLASNVTLLERVRKIADALGRPVASAAEVRGLLALNNR
jgi:uncharacterized protein (DUF849 family)